MLALAIHHKTIYRYHEAVKFGPHRLIMRPRESRDLRLVSMALEISPEASVAWAHDVFGNAIATAVIDGVSEALEIQSVAGLHLDAEPWPVFDVAASAANYPFPYSDDDMQDLGGLRLVEEALRSISKLARVERLELPKGLKLTERGAASPRLYRHSISTVVASSGVLPSR